MKPLITKETPGTDEVLNAIAHLPTRSLSKIVEDGFFQKLADRDFMRIAVLLALNLMRGLLSARPADAGPLSGEGRSAR